MSDKPKRRKRRLTQGAKLHHDLSWHPQYAWELLRRSNSYRQAVREFVASCEDAKDHASLAAYRMFSKEHHRPRPGRRRHHIEKKISWETRQERLAFKSGPVLQLFGTKFRKDKLGTFRGYEIDTSTPHYKKFFKRFGDFLIFPMNPKVRLPATEGFNAVWIFSPISNLTAQLSSLPFHLLHFENGVLNVSGDSNLAVMMVAVNKKFPRNRIVSDFAKLLDYTLGSHKVRVPQPAWDILEFYRYIAIIDFLEEADTEGWPQPGYQKIGDKFAPSYDREARFSWARSKMITIRELRAFFERPLPKRSAKKVQVSDHK